MRSTPVHTDAARWVRAHARPLATLDPEAALEDLRPFAESIRDAEVVALAHSMRHSHELSAVSHRVLRLLVEEYGFRSLALEGDDPVRRGLAEYVHDGTGDPRRLLAESRSFWQTGEILDVVTWMRAHNQRHPGDPVRFAESPVPEPEFTGPESLPAIERYLAESTAWWREHSGDRIVYWGGLAHMSVATPGYTTPHRNAGSYLREQLGTGYAAIGLTFHHGTALHRYPEPPADFAESVLDAAGHEAFTLDLRADDSQDPAAHAWLNGPTRTRLIGPVYDPAHDADYHLATDTLGDLLDGVIHVNEVTDARALDAPHPRAPRRSVAAATPRHARTPGFRKQVRDHECRITHRLCETPADRAANHPRHISVGHAEGGPRSCRSNRRDRAARRAPQQAVEKPVATGSEPDGLTMGSQAHAQVVSLSDHLAKKKKKVQVTG